MRKESKAYQKMEWMALMKEMEWICPRESNADIERLSPAINWRNLRNPFLGLTIRMFSPGNTRVLYRK
jgi:hypothetical protein